MGDLIERDAALARIDCCLGNSLGGRKEFDNGLMQARKFVLSTPTVNLWIPCSERLPGRFDSVLLAILSKNGYGEPAYYVTIGGMKNGNEFESYTGDICECEKVTHWMPLPEPPESEVQHD